MKTTNILLTILLLLLSVTGCTSDEQGDDPVTNGKGEYAVNFSGNINLTQTKVSSSESVATGVKAKISTFVTDETSTPVVDAKGYTVATAGKFNGDDSFVMYLAKGSYDFYAVSANITTSANGIPVFSSGTSTTDLQNKVDYIYANSKNVAVPATGGGSDNNITLNFEHKAVRITIDVKSGTGLELTGWQDGDDHATITPPVITNCKMNLTDGVITPATSVNTIADNMETTAVATKASTASYTMLPLAASGGNAHQLTVTFKVKVQVGGRAEENRTYTATLTAPNTSDNGNTTAFQSGKNYTYTATLNPTAITFTGATVTDWTQVGTMEDLKPNEPDPVP